MPGGAHSTAPEAVATLPWSDRMPPEADVAIVGGGFSGLMTLVHVLGLAPRARIVLLERRPTRTPGVAYGACDPAHLLNVPADRMGATTADVGGFHAWLERRMPGRFAPGAFAPRRLYGAYLLELVAARLAPERHRVCLVRDAVVHVEPAPEGFELLTASGRTCVARCTVLAPGIPPGRAPWARSAAGAPRRLLRPDPWDAGAFEGVPAEAPVLIVGSGLTAIDVVLALRERGHRGAVTMVSRNGKLPLPHAAAGEPAHRFERAQLAGGPARVLHAIRHAARERTAAGLGWQGALDAVRPFTTEIWRAWSGEERQRFLRHARPMWEVHRHRVPRDILARLEDARRAGLLDVVRGSLRALGADGSGMVRAAIALHGGGTRTLDVARVFNCIGPATSVRQTADPLLRSLFASGMARSDAAGLGVHADDAGRVVSEGGTVDPRLFLVGALRRADVWESTAVPELRAQCEGVAHEVARILDAGEGAATAAPRGESDAHGTRVLEGCG
jgi:uncharacterized NAD(P)/FAD-binding protein YdhS